MCRYLDNNILIGNLLIKFLEKDIEVVSFQKIYDFLYYTSLKLNEDENAVILASKESIYNFVDQYRNLLQISENNDSIKILHIQDSLKRFRACYEKYGKAYADAFKYAEAKVC